MLLPQFHPTFDAPVGTTKGHAIYVLQELCGRWVNGKRE